MSISKYAGTEWCDIGSIVGTAASSIEKASDIDGGSCGPTVAVVTSQDNWVMVSTTAGFGSGSWTSYQSNSRTTDSQRNVDYGLNTDGSGVWIIVNNKSARPIRVSTEASPDASGEWTEVNPTGEAGYDVTHGINGTFVLVGNDAEVAAYQGAGGESITTAGDWNGRRPLNGDLATSKFLTGVGFNHNADSPLYVAVSNTGRIFSSTDGGDGDAADWTTRYGTVGTSGANHSESRALWEIAYGNDKWVAVGYYDRMEHVTGSGDATEWGVMNLPSGDPTREMYGVDSDGNNNWVIAGKSGYVWHSTDNAASWTENQVNNVDGGTPNYQCVRYDGAGTWWLVGGAGYLAYSTDMTNWTSFRTPVTDTGGSTSYSIAFNTIRTS